MSAASKVAVGQTVTATARSINLDASNGGTSEFSAPKTVALASGSVLAPEATKLSGPSGVTKSPAAHFEFDYPTLRPPSSAAWTGGHYGCSSPENINRLSEGRHTLEARAVDEEGNVDPSPAAWTWSVDRKAASS